MQELDRVFKHKNEEFWWDIHIGTSTNIKHIKPDIFIWNHKDRQCTTIEFNCPTDINFGKKIKEKMGNYGPLIRNLQMMHENYDFKFILIVIDAMGCVPKTLNRYLQDLESTKKLSQHLTRI